mgnify:CR=1 FL=1
MIQTTNIRRIADRVKRKKMLQGIPFETIVEHTIDFIELLGCPALYDEKTAVVEVHNWRGALPCDFHDVRQVRVAPTQDRSIWRDFVTPTRVFRASGDSFHMSEYKPNAAIDLTYQIHGMVIFTSTKDMNIEIAYEAFAVDDEGYPLLPNNASFLRGLEAYIKMKWFEDLFDEGKISQAVMERTDREYYWAVGDAEAEFGRLTLDEAETLFNSFKTMLPRNREHGRGFLTNGMKR